MIEIIQQFSDEYEFLSNFCFSKITYDGLEYLSAESAYQAQKTLDLEKRKQFQLYLPSRAKRHGRKLKLRPDWEQVKDKIMYEIVLAKFTQNDSLRIALLSTTDSELIEGNTWGDTYWGVYKGQGQNKLGKILMDVRHQLQIKEGDKSYYGTN